MEHFWVGQKDEQMVTTGIITRKHSRDKYGRDG